MSYEWPYDVTDLIDWTGENEWHSHISIKLGELIDSGVFSWENDALNWKPYAYDEEQYSRLCSYFIERFRFREIGIIPYWEWEHALFRMLAFELMPKYKPLYESYNEGYNPLADSDEYHKRRTIESGYPETLLSANADYISDGQDMEYETLKMGNAADNMSNYKLKAQSVDEMVCDELERLFVSGYSNYVNGY